MSVSTHSTYKLLPAAISSALKAGEQIMKVYQDKRLEITLKSDETPVTRADRLAHKAVVATLNSTGIPVLSEEGELLPFNERRNWSKFWLVDPLDGTKEFINGNDEFTVNIALMAENVPVLGVIYIPAENKLYFGHKTTGAFLWKGKAIPQLFEDLLKETEKLPRSKNGKCYRIVGSRSHMDDSTTGYIDEHLADKLNCEIVNKGSSIKFCMIAEGSADIYPRFSPVMEWDVAAGDAIVAASGGKVTMVDGITPLVYNKPDLKVYDFIATAANLTLLDR